MRMRRRRRPLFHRRRVVLLQLIKTGDKRRSGDFDRTTKAVSAAAAM